MPSLTSGVVRCRAAGLALLAMLLLSVGPLLSQVLLPAQPAWLSALACGDQPGAVAGDHAPQGHAPLWAKCGYCTLLFSSPALNGPVAPLALGLLSSSQVLLSAKPQAALGLPAYHATYSRAPPVIS